MEQYGWLLCANNEEPFLSFGVSRAIPGRFSPKKRAKQTRTAKAVESEFKVRADRELLNYLPLIFVIKPHSSHTRTK